MQLQNDMTAIKATKLQVIGVSYDSVAILKKFADRRKIEYSLLSDAKSKTIDAYKLRNKNVRRGSRGDGIPIPATIVIDKQGIVRANLPGTTRRRHPTKDLIAAAKKLGK